MMDAAAATTTTRCGRRGRRGRRGCRRRPRRRATAIGSSSSGRGRISATERRRCRRWSRTISGAGRLGSNSQRTDDVAQPQTRQKDHNEGNNPEPGQATARSLRRRRRDWNQCPPRRRNCWPERLPRPRRRRRRERRGWHDIRGADCRSIRIWPRPLLITRQRGRASRRRRLAHRRWRHRATPRRRLIRRRGRIRLHTRSFLQPLTLCNRIERLNHPAPARHLS